MAAPLYATPHKLYFGDLLKGHTHSAMQLQLHSPNAADAVEIRTHCSDPRLTVEALPGQPGAVRVALLCSAAGTVEGTLVCTSPSGSITVPISARVLEPTVYAAMSSSTPGRAQPQPSGVVEQLSAGERPSAATVDAKRRPLLLVRARRVDEPGQAATLRRPAATVPLVWMEKDPALQGTPPAEIGERERQAIAQAQISEGAARQQGESRDIAGAQRSLLRLVHQLHAARNALAAAEQQPLPEEARAPCRALLAEFEKLDPLISDAESFAARQYGAGQRRAAAMQKAELAPALVEQAARSERWAHATLAGEQGARRDVEAQLRAAERRADADAAALAETREALARREAEAERLRAEAARLAGAEAEARARLLPLQRECEAMRAALRKVDAQRQEEAAQRADVGALEAQRDAARAEAAALLKSRVPRAEAEAAEARAAWLGEQLEAAQAGLAQQRALGAQLGDAARLDAEWRAAAQRALERLQRWSRRADVAPRLPDAAGHFKAQGDPFAERAAEAWLGTLAGIVGEAARALEMAELLPRAAAADGAALRGRLGAAEEARKSHKAKLLAARARLSAVVMQRGTARTLAEAMQAWRLFVRRAAAARAAEGRAQAEERAAAARRGADEVAGQSRAALQQALDAAQREMGRREAAEAEVGPLREARGAAEARAEAAEAARAAAEAREAEQAESGREHARLVGGELDAVRAEARRAHAGHDAAEARARGLHAKLKAEERRAAGRERLLQAYARESLKRLGFDPVALAAEREREAVALHPPPVSQPPLVRAAPTHAAAPAPPFAPQKAQKAPPGAVMPGFRYRLPPSLPAGARHDAARPPVSRPHSASLTRPAPRPGSAGATRPASARRYAPSPSVGGTLQEG